MERQDLEIIGTYDIMLDEQVDRVKWRMLGKVFISCSGIIQGDNYIDDECIPDCILVYFPHTTASYHCV